MTVKTHHPSAPGGHVFFGFGLGPIQAGLFIKEARDSGNFSRIVVAENDPELVSAVRQSHGVLWLNVAGRHYIRTEMISGVEIFNPCDPADRPALLDALSSATEIVTALPSVRIYEAGGAQSPAALIAEALRGSSAPFTLIYTAENDNHAAEKLEAAVMARLDAPPGRPVQFLNTVIGKMSQVLRDMDFSNGCKPVALTYDFNRAFLVEEFNRILVTRCRLPGVQPGIDVFIEKENLLPFEESKLYGHNAVHALAGYMGKEKGLTRMDQVLADPDIHRICREAFIDEAGRALISRYAGTDPLFTPDDFAAYADDLLVRMGNPHLMDAVERVVRDPERKLGWNDRLTGTLRMALGQGGEPYRFARGLLIAARLLNPEDPVGYLEKLWIQERASQAERDTVIQWIGRWIALS